VIILRFYCIFAVLIIYVQRFPKRADLIDTHLAEIIKYRLIEIKPLYTEGSQIPIWRNPKNKNSYIDLSSIWLLFFFKFHPSYVIKNAYREQNVIKQKHY